MSTRRKKPRKPEVKTKPVSSTMTEAQSRAVASVGLSCFIGMAFPTMSPESAVLEAGRHIDALASVENRPALPGDAEQSVELLAEWLYGLSRRYGKVKVTPAVFNACLEGLQMAMFQHIRSDIRNVPRRARLRMVDSFFDWVKANRVSVLSLALDCGDKENAGFVLATASLCTQLNRAVNVDHGAFSWPATIADMIRDSRSMLTEKQENMIANAIMFQYAGMSTIQGTLMAGDYVVKRADGGGP